jgi:hypothetical protein
MYIYAKNIENGGYKSTTIMSTGLLILLAFLLFPVLLGFLLMLA